MSLLQDSTTDIDLAEQIAVFLLRKRQFPGEPHEALVVGKYYVVDKIDEGAMGIVCTALERNFGTVALKIPKALSSSRLRKQILQEGQLLARVHHTNVLRVYEVGEWASTLFIATEYVAGETLRTWQSGRDWRTVVRAYLDAARGLAAIHAQQIVHQDIKPDNIRIDTHGAVRVLDFGLAHLESTILGHPATDIPVDRAGATRPTFYRGGTPGYMAPEQYRNDTTIDARADQFAFCAALWEALHGVLPYPAEAIASTTVGSPRHPLGPPRTGAPTAIPRWLRSLLLRGLSEHREARFASVQALISAIERRLERRWWPLLLLGGATGLLGALGMALISGPSLPMCNDPGEALAGVWDPAREQELAAAFTMVRDPAAARTWEVMQSTLHSQAQRWQYAHAERCRAAVGHGDPAIVRDHEACFTARRQDLELVAEAMQRFAHRHAGDLHIDWDAQQERWRTLLGDIDDCKVPGPANAAFSPSQIVLDSTLRRARAALLDDDPNAARPLLRWSLDAAPFADDPRRRAQALLELGRVSVALQTNLEADAALREAVLQADTAGDDLVASDALALLAFLAGDRSDHPDRAELWYDLARGRLSRLGLDTSPRALNLHISAGLAAVRIGDPRAARRHLDRAAELRARLGSGERQQAREEQVRAELASLLGDQEIAIALDRTAYARVVQDGGPDSAAAANLLMNIGKHHNIAAQYAAAEPVLLHALYLRDRQMGRDSVESAAIHVELGNAYYGLGRHNHALYHADLARPGLTADHPFHRGLQTEHAALQAHLALYFTRDYDAAARSYRQGIAMAGPAPPSAYERSNLALMQVGLVQAEYLGGRCQAAQAALSPLLAQLGRAPEFAAYRGPLLQLAAELSLALGDPLAAAKHAHAALALLPAEELDPAPVERTDLNWTLARALGPHDPAGRAAAEKSLTFLRQPKYRAELARLSLRAETIEAWSKPVSSSRPPLKPGKECHDVHPNPAL